MDDELGNLYDVHYDGSRIFSWVAEIFGLSVDLVIVFLCTLCTWPYFIGRCRQKHNMTSSTILNVPNVLMLWTNDFWVISKITSGSGFVSIIEKKNNDNNTKISNLQSSRFFFMRYEKNLFDCKVHDYTKGFLCCEQF